MKSPLHKGIRLRITLVAILGTLLAMACVVAVTVVAMQQILESAISDDLEEHIDRAEEAVALGQFELAVQYAGSDILQIIDESGKVVASSANARGLAAIVKEYKNARYEITKQALEDEERERDEDEDGGDSSSDAAPTASADDSDGEGERADTTPSASTMRSQNADSESDDDGDDADGDADDGDDVNDRDDADDGNDADDGAGNRGDDGDDYRDDDGEDGDDGRGEDSDDSDSDSDDDDDDDDDDEGGNKAGKRKGVCPPSRSANPRLWEELPIAIVCVQKAYAQDSGSDAAAPNDQGKIRVDVSSVLGDDGPYLVMERLVESPSGKVTIAAMTSYAPALRAATTAGQLLGAVMLVLLVAVGFFAWRLTGRTLQPVEQMRASVEAINAHDLSARVVVPENDSDLAPLAVTFNEMLARVESVVNEQKRFVSDASHELKSPIAATAIMLEAIREYPEAVDVDQLFEDLAMENERMARIVGNMLMLARYDEGRVKLDIGPLDLYDIIHDEIALLATRSDVAIDASDVSPVVCLADRSQLSAALRNLLDNAARYAESAVKVSCEVVGPMVRITVSDDGPGIPPEDRERVFGRFVRLEGSGRDDEGTGLGLSVVKSAVERLGGTVRFADSELGGATAVVELPAEQEGSSSSYSNRSAETV